ncbi:hypothetical protein IQ270_25875 [Microcoleus sp. LEGE 07076]|nr:hypothetical protein [Microcoleus sp. LEGE 07076]MBE9187976.1 hypothetical protein [Microcoleus sp. LEGE 07076]
MGNWEWGIGNWGLSLQSTASRGGAPVPALNRQQPTVNRQPSTVNRQPT